MNPEITKRLDEIRKRLRDMSAPYSVTQAFADYQSDIPFLLDLVESIRANHEAAAKRAAGKICGMSAGSQWVGDSHSPEEIEAIILGELQK